MRLGTFIVVVVMVARAAAAEPSAPERIAEASRLQDAGKFDKAALAWKAFLDTFPGDPAGWYAYHGLGVCLLEAGKLPEAIDDFDRALVRLPKGESGATIRWNLAVAWSRRAESTGKVADRLEAVKALTAVIQSTETRKELVPQARLHLADLLRRIGGRDQAAEAERTYKAILDDAPSDAIARQALEALGQFAEGRRDEAAAIVWYRQVFDLRDPGLTDPLRLHVADLLVKTDRLTEAEAEYDTIRKSKDAKIAGMAWIARARTASARGRTDEAIEILDGYLARFPEHPDRTYALQLKPYFLLNKAFALAQAGEVGKAEALALSAIPSMHGDHRGRGLWFLARVAQQLNRPKDALQRYKECLEVVPQRAPGGILPGLSGSFTSTDIDQLLSEAVTTAFAADDGADGLRWTDRLVKEKAGVHAQLAQAEAARWLAGKEKYDQALERCDWLLNQTGAEGVRPAALNLAGYCRVKLRKFDGGITAYETLLKDFPRSAEAPAARFGLGVAHEGAGSTRLALAEYERLIKDFPDDPLAGRARKRLAELRESR